MKSDTFIYNDYNYNPDEDMLHIGPTHSTVREALKILAFSFKSFSKSSYKKPTWKLSKINNGVSLALKNATNKREGHVPE